MAQTHTQEHLLCPSQREDLDVRLLLYRGRFKAENLRAGGTV